MFQKVKLSYFSNLGQVEWQKLESDLGFPSSLIQLRDRATAELN
jgi:hypothetical protein